MQMKNKLVAAILLTGFTVAATIVGTAPQVEAQDMGRVKREIRQELERLGITSGFSYDAPGGAGDELAADPIKLDDGSGNVTYLSQGGADGQISVGTTDGGTNGTVLANRFEKDGRFRLFEQQDYVILDYPSDAVSNQGLLVRNLGGHQKFAVAGDTSDVAGAADIKIRPGSIFGWTDDSAPSLVADSFRLGLTDEAAGVLKVYDPSGGSNAAVRTYDAAGTSYASLSHDGTHASIIPSTGGIFTKVPVESVTAGSGAPNVLTASESGKRLNNTGATAEAYNTLPSASAGLVFVLTITDADGARFTAATGDTITVNGVTSAAAGHCTSTTVGSTVVLVAQDDTVWDAETFDGTWTVN